MEYIEHPLLKEKKLEARLYQELLATRAIEQGNTLIVAPTALGKCIDLSEDVLVEYKNRRLMSGVEIREELEKAGVLTDHKEQAHKLDGFRVYTPDEKNGLKLADAYVYLQKYNGDLFEITTNRGRKVKTTPEHPLLTFDGKTAQWKKTKELEKGVFIGAPRVFHLSEKTFKPSKKLRTADALYYDDLEKLKEKTRTFSKMDWRDMELLRRLACCSYAKAARELGTSERRIKRMMREPSERLVSFLVSNIKMGKNSVVLPLSNGFFSTFRTIDGIDEDVMKWLAFVHAEGTSEFQDTGLGSVSISQKTYQDMLDEVLEITKRKFGVEFRRKGAIDWKLNNRGFVMYLRDCMDFKTGNSRQSPICDWILGMPKGLQRVFLRWFITLECEAQKDRLVVTQANRRSANILALLLSNFGIPTVLATETKYASNTTAKKKREYYSVQIFGKENLQKYVEDIGLCDIKKERLLLSHTKTKRHTNTDTIPINAAEMRELLKLLGIEAAKRGGSGIYHDFHQCLSTGRGRISFTTLERVLPPLKKRLAALETMLLEEPATWEEMKRLHGEFTTRSHSVFRTTTAKRGTCQYWYREQKQFKAIKKELLDSAKSRLLLAKEQLDKLTFISQYRWMRIKEIRKCANANDQVIDLCVPETSQFIGGFGGLLLHNTPIALMIALHHMAKQPKKKVLFLAPTKPLVAQHLKSFEEFTHIMELDLLTGETPAPKRKQMWNDARVVFATPQTVESCIFSGDIDLSEVALLIFDEAHRAIGDYSYVFIADQFKRKAKGSILALTASPGSTREKIQEVCGNLFITNVEVRNEQDDDVKEYVHDKEFDWIYVELPPEYKQIKQLLEEVMTESLVNLKSLGFAKNTSLRWYGRKNLLAMQMYLMKIKTKDPKAWKAISEVAGLMKLHHAHELVETQGIKQLNTYFEKLWKEETKAAARFKENVKMQKAKHLCEKTFEEKIRHPKLERLIQLLDGDGQAIVFTHYRASSQHVSHFLNSNGISAKRFVGQSTQAGEKGLRQREQIDMIDEFRNKDFRVLVATSLHPEEFIILKNPKNQIVITRIGEFVESFIEDTKGKTKKISGWESLTFDGKNNVFRPVTQVFKHKRQSKVVKTKLSSGMECLVTEDHSLFTFDGEKNFIETPPEKNSFVLAARNVPDGEHGAISIDLVKELLEHCPKTELKKLYCSIDGMSQPRIRMLTSELKVLNAIKCGVTTPKKMALVSGLDPSAVTDVLKRLDKATRVKRLVVGRYHRYSLTNEGINYLSFLEWFFSNVKYSKKKYRASLQSVVSSPIDLSLFCKVYLETRYSHTRLPRHLPFNDSLAAFLGFYVSEGSARITKEHTNVFLSARKKKMQKLMIKSVENGLKLRPNVCVRGVAVDSYLVALLIKYVFKCGFGAYHKEIPYWVFNAPRKEKLAFLEAYFLGDGHGASNRIVFTTVSRKLAAGLMLLLRQLGITKITTRKDTCHRVNCYESLPFWKIVDTKGWKAYYANSPTAFEKPKYFSQFGNKYAHVKSRVKTKIKTEQKEDFCFDYIKDITPLREQPEYVYDIAVEGTEKFFGGIGPICLHNSVGEEGLDIPSVDQVIFYEPVASEIRKIQRAGRTGRHHTGQVVVLVTKDTVDEAYYWASKRKEKNMKEALEELSSSPISEKQQTLSNFANLEKVTVFVDQRERASGITRELMANQDIQIKPMQLPVGDFLVSERVVVERKSANDFVQSIIDGRLFEQAQSLVENFRNPIILIEGEDLYSVRNVHPNAIRGALAALAVDFHIPIIWSKSVEDSAGIITVLAKREQEEKKQNVRLRGDKKAMDDMSQQEFLVGGLPGVGGLLAKDLLSHFGSVEKVFTADEKELKNVEKIGSKKAKEIRRVLTKEYQ